MERVLKISFLPLWHGCQHPPCTLDFRSLYLKHHGMSTEPGGSNGEVTIKYVRNEASSFFRWPFAYLQHLQATQNYQLTKMTWILSLAYSALAGLGAQVFSIIAHGLDMPHPNTCSSCWRKTATIVSGSRPSTPQPDVNGEQRFYNWNGLTLLD